MIVFRFGRGSKPIPRRCPTTASSHLVVLGGGDEEEDGGDGVEALEPAPPLRALAAHVHHFEGHVLDLEVVLVDALGGLPGQEDVLLAGEVALRGGGGETPSLWSLRCKVEFERRGCCLKLLLSPSASGIRCT